MPSTLDLPPAAPPPPADEGSGTSHFTLAAVLSILAGPIAALVVYFLLAPAGLTPEGRIVAAVGVLMMVWWISEALPIAVTGLVPMAIMAPLLGLSRSEYTAFASPYADPIIALFLGGMLLGKAMERWQLHRRLALGVIHAVGSSPTLLVAGFLIATGFLSLWVSNTAATVMMLPIGASVAIIIVARLRESTDPRAATVARAVGPALVLAIAYGASIGGVGTLIGTPPITQYAGFSRERLGVEVSFLAWMKLGIPVVAVMLFAAWVVLSRIAFRLSVGKVEGVGEYLESERRALGRLSVGEWGVLGVFLLACAGWMTSSWTGLPDASVAMLAALLLFIVPARDAREGGNATPPTWRPLLTWREAATIPWGVLLLFGGGLALAKAIETYGVDDAIAGLSSGLGGMPLFVVLFAVAAVSLILTEFASNTALVAIALPIGAAMAPALGVPAPVLLVTITLAASLGFAMPAGTAPNALVFASGLVRMRDMVRAGLWLDVVAAFFVPVVVLVAMKLGLLPGG
jgi:sodium-dependent dicarboxylate transporter 2/3/5